MQTYSLFIANIDKTQVAPDHIVEQVEKDTRPPRALPSAASR